VRKPDDNQHFEESKIVWMQGLRVYINPVDTDARNERGVFYSRRDDGPYYRWQYKDAPGQWCCSRVRPTDFVPHALSLARWKSVPVELQTSLVQHYLE
jgi:hypothetical protein